MTAQLAQAAGLRSESCNAHLDCLKCPLIACAGEFQQAEATLNAPDATARPARTVSLPAWRPGSELDSERAEEQRNEVAAALSPQPDMALPAAQTEMETPALPGQAGKAQQPFAVEQRRRLPQVPFLLCPLDPYPCCP